MKLSHLKVLSLMSLLFLLAGCGGSSLIADDSGTIPSDSAGSETTSIDNNTDVTIDDNVTSGSYITNSSDIIITLIDNASTTSNSSCVVISGNVITINTVGTYVVSGTLSDGKIIITASKTSSVEDTEIVLNGVSITCSTAAPIYSSGTSKLKLFKAKGSVNYIHDTRLSGGTYTGDDNAAIFADKKLKIFGTGKLSVETSYNNGVGSDNGVELKNGTLVIVSYNHSIKSHESIELGGTVGDDEGGVFNLKSSTGSCIRSDSGTDIDSDTSTYYLSTITQGTYVLVSEYDGIEIDGLLNISGGDIEVTCGGLGKTACGSSSSYTLSTDMPSRKGIKSDHDINISGSSTTISLDCYDDGIHSGGNIAIYSGVFSVSVATSSKKSTSSGMGGSSTSGSDGIHADGTVTISGGTITVVKSYEAVEGIGITFSGGTTYLTATDDGTNVNQTGGVLTISGGYLFIDSGGDGLDSNGSVIMTGGVVVVAGPTGSGDGPLDFGDGYSMSISGGILVAYGSSGMAVGPTLGSQYSILARHSSVVSSSSYYLIVNSSGVVEYAIKPLTKSSFNGSSSS